MQKRQKKNQQANVGTTTIVETDADGIPYAGAYLKQVEPPGRGYWWIVPKCPLCGDRHVHGGGNGDKDPRRFLSHRVGHCLTRTLESERGYILVELDEIPD